MSRLRGIDAAQFEYLRLIKDLPEEVVYRDLDANDVLDTQTELFIPNPAVTSGCGKHEPYLPASPDQKTLIEKVLNTGTSLEELEYQRPEAETYYRLKNNLEPSAIHTDVESLIHKGRLGNRSATDVVRELAFRKDAHPEIAFAAARTFNALKFWDDLGDATQILLYSGYSNYLEQAGLWMVQSCLEPESMDLDRLTAYLRTLPDADARKKAVAHYAEDANTDDLKQEKIFSALSEAFPKDDAFHHYLGRAQMYDAEKRVSAIYHLQQAASLNPRVPAYLTRLGFALKENGNYREAKKIYFAAAAQDPQFHTEYLMELAEIFFKQTEYAEALSCLDAIIVIEPMMQEALKLKGILLMMAGDFTGASFFFK